MVKLTPLYDPSNGQMRVVGLLSGSGSNIRKIIEFEKQLKIERGASPFSMVVLFSDNSESNAVKIGKDFDIPVVVRDIIGFYAARGKPRRDMQVRAEFDRETVNALAPYKVSVAAYGGYMSIATQPLIDAFLGVNVHPADLSIRENGKRKYTGDFAVRNAILNGEKFLRSSTHIIEPEVDGGRILMISPKLEVSLRENFDKNYVSLVKEVANEHQSKLKEYGDWVIFPKTLLYIAEGRFAQDENGSLYFDGKQIPQGLRLEA